LPVKEFFLEIPSNPNSLPEVEDLLLQIGKDYNIEKIKFNNFILSVNEATTNAMLHGNRGQVDKKVKITLVVSENEIKATIKDEGRGFDPQTVPDPTEPENLFKESGRGLYIMNTCMDSVIYNFTPDGTELTLIMKF
jgi:serine/threonine-protein kinase RsbW